MSQLSATDANGDTVNLLATADDASGGGGLGIIRYDSFGANGGTVYSVLNRIILRVLVFSLEQYLEMVEMQQLVHL